MKKDEQIQDEERKQFDPNQTAPESTSGDETKPEISLRDQVLGALAKNSSEKENLNEKIDSTVQTIKLEQKINDAAADRKLAEERRRATDHATDYFRRQQEQAKQSEEDDNTEENSEEPKVANDHQDSTVSATHDEEISRSKRNKKRDAGHAESRRRKESRKKEASMVKKIVTIVLLALVVILIILGFSFYKYWQAGLKPLDSKNNKLVQVEIPIGTSNKGIGTILEKKKVIKSGLVFTYYVKTENLGDFKGGYYQMSPDMTLSEVAELLKQGGTDEPIALADAHLTIPEGYSIDQIADKLGKKKPKEKQKFLDTVQDEAFFAKLAEKYPILLASAKDAKDVRYRLEGYLFPATYNYYKKMSIEDLITQMVDKTNSELQNNYETIKEQNLTVQQVLTLASLVEKEGVTKEDRRKIAQVFFNRITADMPLQSDISILYAMQQHKVHLSEKDTQIASPYNLYINKGFGPGPFNNPGAEAIDAVLHPAETTALYFLADVDTGKVYFADTYEQHLELKKKYIDDKN